MVRSYILMQKSANFSTFFSSKRDILISGKWCLMVTLICASLLVSDFGHFHIPIRHFHVVFEKNSLDPLLNVQIC